ncbi:MAG: EAL domain-containing protein [Microthrixaceae bacterium]|nr:EAL domain-containing protein [Microthrixaceae bacterium]
MAVASGVKCSTPSRDCRPNEVMMAKPSPRGALHRLESRVDWTQDGDTDQRARERLFRQRYVVVAALAVAVLVLPEISRSLAIAILIVGLGFNAIGHLVSRRSGRIPLWLFATDLSGCIGFPLLYPVTMVPAAFMALTIVAMAATLNWGGGGGGAPGRGGRPPAGPRQHLNGVIDGLDAALWICSVAEDRMTFVNQRAIAMLGWSEEQWLEPGFWAARVHPDDLDTTQTALNRSITLGVDTDVTYRFRTFDGHWVHLHDRITADVDSNGQTKSLRGLSLDVSEQFRIEQRVNQYADIVDRIDLALLVLRLDEGPDATLVMDGANAAASRLVHRDLHPLIGTALEDAFPALAGSRLRTRLALVIERGVPLRVDDLLVRPTRGEPRVVTLRAFPLTGRSVGVSLQDVTESVAASEALRRQALYDSLTGLPNRRLLDEELHRTLNRDPLPGETIALLVMDLDQFKEVNDALGHHVGDQLLRSIGDRLTRELSDSLVARLGGDEFAVVLSGLVDEADARRVADRIRSTLAEPFVLEDVRLQSNASIGIALYPEHARDVPTLIQRADVAMYMAKRAGAGVAVYSAEHDRSSIERLTLIGDLPEAAAAGQFVLHYQPCVALRTGEVVRVEALIRWQHPRFGLLPPDQFVELAELSGAIQPMTRWVISEGLAAVKTWRDAGFPIGLAVNLSVRNLYDPDLVDHLQWALLDHGVRAGDLVLELTETELMDDPSLAREVFTAFGDLGVNTAIDDFGTGYSSLTYLRDLPLQEIKIDKSFVAEMHRRSDEFTIVRSMIDLGHNLGLEVVAEGVEHADDLQLLRRLGCDLGQGYHFSRPLPLDELLVWLEQWEKAGAGEVSPTRK